MFCVHYFAFASKGQILRNVFPSSSLDLICKYVTKSFSWPLRRFRIIIKQKRDVEGLRDLQSIRIQEHRWKFEFVFLVSGKLDLVSLRDACCQARVRELVTHWWGRIFSKKPRELRGAGQATRNLIYTVISVIYILSRRFLRQSTNVLSVTQFVKMSTRTCSAGLYWIRTVMNGTSKVTTEALSYHWAKSCVLCIISCV